MVYYRKYRPQSLEDLIGQPSVTSTLKQALLNQKLAHAYLFSGPRGTGKTSTARILAKMVNCQKDSESKTEPLPCNSCASCQSITDGTNLDVIEIDAASNRGIDDIRELREKIKLAPTSSLKKVYIIDEVHMLTSEAFNALLKTLEEPPSHVLFILATTDPQKIPQTILSRVQRLNFQLASTPDLIQALKKVVEKEKIKISDDALTLIAKKGDGSFRDSLKILDQLASTAEEISIEYIESTLKSSSFDHIVQMLELLAKKDPATILTTLATHLEGGVNIKDYTLSLMDALRSMLYIKQKIGHLVSKDIPSSRYQSLEVLANNFSVSELLSILHCLQSSIEKLKYTYIPSLPLEVALVECTLVTTSKPVPSTHLSTPLLSPESTDQPNPQKPLTNNTSGNNSSLVDDHISGADDIMALQDKWTYILETIKPFNFSLEALLRSVRLLRSEGGRVTIEVPYSFHQRILETPRNRDMLESVFSEVLGKATKISCALGKRPVRVEEIANVELAADDEVIRLAAEIFNSDNTN